MAEPTATDDEIEMALDAFYAPRKYHGHRDDPFKRGYRDQMRRAIVALKKYWWSQQLDPFGDEV